MRITEIKRHIDGCEDRFELGLVLQQPHLVIGSYEHPRSWRSGSFAFERGALSYGFFWRRRPYVMYRMLDPQGQLVANRFDVVEEVRLGDQTVSYTDLLLDLWVDCAGIASLEDEDEVADAKRDGLLSHAQLDRIEKTKGLLLRRHAAIANEAAGLLP